MLNDPKNLFLWIPIAIGMGISVYFSLGEEPSCWFTTLSPLLFILAFFLRRSPLIFYGLCVVGLMFLGFSAAILRTHVIKTTMLAETLSEKKFTGTVEGIEDKEKGRRILIGKIHLSDPQDSFPQKARLTLTNSVPAPKIGDVIQGYATFFPLSDPVSLTGFDFRRDAFFKGIGAIGRLQSWEKIEAETSFFNLMIENYRHHLTNLLKKNVGGVEGGIAAALVTGERSVIPADVRQYFTDAGLAHVLAISGLHLGLVAGFFFMFLRRGFAFFPSIVERFSTKKLVAALVIPFLFFYLLISGSGVPAQRAFLMICIVMIGIILDRQAFSMRLAAIAAIFILLYRPESLISASFQLSFSAVIALIAAYEGGWIPLYEWSRSGGFWRRPIAYGVGVIATTIIATLATMPLTIYIFNRFTLQAILGNLIAIPLTALFIMPLLLLGLFTLLWGGSDLVFKAIHLSLKILIQTADSVAHLPGAAIKIPTPPFLFLALTTFGGLWLCLWRSKLRWWGVPAISLGLISVFFTDSPDILIAKEGQVMAYRLDKTLYVSSTQYGHFFTECWAKEVGAETIAPWPDPVTVFSRNTLSALLVASPKGRYEQIKEIYSQYSAVFSTGFVERLCPNHALCIDRPGFSSTALIWLKEGGISIKWVAHSLGNRPWVSGRFKKE